MSVYLKIVILYIYFSHIRKESQTMIFIIMQDRILRNYKIFLIGFLILNIKNRWIILYPVRYISCRLNLSGYNYSIS
jgi:hypothetical protein